MDYVKSFIDGGSQHVIMFTKCSDITDYFKSLLWRNPCVAILSNSLVPVKSKCILYTVITFQSGSSSENCGPWWREILYLQVIHFCAPNQQACLTFTHFAPRSPESFFSASLPGGPMSTSGWLNWELSSGTVGLKLPTLQGEREFHGNPPKPVEVRKISG